MNLKCVSFLQYFPVSTNDHQLRLVYHKPRVWLNNTQVLTDSLLREATRDHMGLLLALTRRPGSGMADGGASPSLKQSSVSLSPAPVSVPREGSLSPGPGSQPGGVKAAAAEGPSALDQLLGGGDAAAAEAGMRTALMGLVWPDAESAAKAAGVCRYFVGLAASAVPSLEPFVCNDMLKTAMVSLAQVI